MVYPFLYTHKLVIQGKEAPDGLFFDNSSILCARTICDFDLFFTKRARNADNHIYARNEFWVLLCLLF